MGYSPIVKGAPRRGRPPGDPLAKRSEPARVMLRPGEYDDLAAIADCWGVPIGTAAWAMVVDFIGKARRSSPDLAEVGVAAARVLRLAANEDALAGRAEEQAVAHERRTSEPIVESTRSTCPACDRSHDPSAECAAVDDDEANDDARAAADRHRQAHAAGEALRQQQDDSAEPLDAELEKIAAGRPR